MSAGAVLLGTVFAAAVIAAATVSVSVRDARVAIIGLLAALLAAPFLADPMADLRGIAARLAGAVLGAYPLWMIYRGREETTTGSRGGIVIDGIVAVVAALTAASAAVGWDVAASLGSGGPAGLAAQLDSIGTSLARPFLPAVAAGGALVVLAVSPVAFARDPLRLTIGLTVGLLGLTIVWTGLAGAPTPFTDLCIGIALMAVCGGGAVLISASRRAAKPLPAAAGLRSLPPLHLPHRPERVRGGRAGRPRAAGRPSVRPADADATPRTGAAGDPADGRASTDPVHPDPVAIDPAPANRAEDGDAITEAVFIPDGGPAAQAAEAGSGPLETLAEAPAGRTAGTPHPAPPSEAVDDERLAEGREP